MRWLLGSLLLVALAQDGRAQERFVHLELANGRAVDGAVLHVDAATIAVRVDGRMQAFRTQDVRVARFALGPSAGGEGEAEIDRSGPGPRPAPGDECALPVAAESLLAQRLLRLGTLVPWLESLAAGHWLLACGGAWVGLMLATHLAARLCAAKCAGVVRAAAMASLVFGLAVLGMAFVPGSAAVSIPMTGLGLVVFLAVLARTYALPIGSACVGVAVLAVQVGLGLLVLRFVDAALRVASNYAH